METAEAAARSRRPRRWWALGLVVWGGALVARGVFVRLHQATKIGWSDLGWLLLTALVSAFLLMVVDYVFHHAFIVFCLMLLFMTLLAVVMPFWAICFGAGLIVIGVMVVVLDR